VELPRQEVIPHQLVFKWTMIQQFIMHWRHKLVGFSLRKALQNVGRVTIFVRVKVVTIDFRKVLDAIHKFLLLSYLTKNVFLKGSSEIICIREIKSLVDFNVVEHLKILFFVIFGGLVDSPK
ncbi:MAG: hypothetical protein ACK55I_45885, partial [bacterium]